MSNEITKRISFNRMCPGEKTDKIFLIIQRLKIKDQTFETKISNKYIYNILIIGIICLFALKRGQPQRVSLVNQ